MKNKKLWIALVVVLVLLGAGLLVYRNSGSKDASPSSSGGRRGDMAGKPVSVVTATAKKGEIEVILNAIGTVTAKNTVVVKPRVDGQLQRILFREGQEVKAGDVLAEIDPRPLQVLLDQANGQLARDQAQLTNAVVDLQRYQILMAKDSIARQQLDTQEALVRQIQGAVQADRALVDSAKLQLSFTRVSAPASGRTGLRLVDVGNMVRASDANGIVVITQIQPINSIFSIPAEQLATVAARFEADSSLQVEAWDRDSKIKLATGKLRTIDNQIDTTTGTVKLKAEFDNDKRVLFPNQFVNIRLRVETSKDAILIPIAAVQRGTQGTFVYVADPAEKTVSLRPITLGTANADVVAVEKGLKAGELVVTDGADKLRQGSKVQLAEAAGADSAKNGAAPPAAGKAAKEDGGERPRWMDRLPPDVAEKVAKMNPEDRRAWILKRREERAKQGGKAE